MNYTGVSAHQTYQKNKYETASPHKLILMLYNAALQNVERARKCIEEGKIAERNQASQQLQNILYELISSLNEDQGGELATNLKNLYLYAIELSIRANIKNDTKPLNEIARMIGEIKEAWEQIGKEVSIGGTYG